MKQRYLRPVCAFLILFGPGCALYGQQQPQPADTLSVDQAVNEAITHNLDFYAQKYDLSIAEPRS